MTDAPAEIARPRQWSDARRQAHAARDERITIPLALPGRGQVGRVELPSQLTADEWELLQGVLESYRGALVQEDEP